jgi:hypothetical protein
MRREGLVDGRNNRFALPQTRLGHWYAMTPLVFPAASTGARCVSNDDFHGSLHMVLWFPAKFSQMPETLLGEFQLLEAHPARALEVIVTGDCRVAALVADKPAVRPGYHLPKLVVGDTVRTPNYGRGHGDIHTHVFFALTVPPL